MRYNIYENGGAVEGLVSIGGMTVTGFIRLRENPLERLEAASKHYVDLLANNIRSNFILSGTFIPSTLPGFTGQVTSVIGNNVLSLGAVNGLNNIFTKITVGVNGLISAGSNITNSDIPALNWNKVTTGLPSDLEGYGITNAVSETNRNITGNLTLNHNPVVSSDVSSRFYADSKPLDSKQYQVGDLITGAYEITPNGFLRCNGGEVSKTTYSALYSILGGEGSGSGSDTFFLPNFITQENPNSNIFVKF